MTKTRQTAKARAKKSRPTTRRAGGSDLLKIAKKMDPAIRQTASRALFESAGNDVVKEFIFPDIDKVDAKDVDHDRMIKTAQWFRDAGRCHDDQFTFVFVVMADSIYGKRCETDSELKRIDREIIILGKKYDVEWDDDVLRGESSPLWADDVEPPPEVQKLFDKYDKRCDEIWAEIFREYGEDKLADLWLKDEAEVWRRVARGREKELGPPPKDLEKKLRKVGIYPLADGGGTTGSS